MKKKKKFWKKAMEVPAGSIPIQIPRH